LRFKNFKAPTEVGAFLCKKKPPQERVGFDQHAVAFEGNRFLRFCRWDIFRIAQERSRSEFPRKGDEEKDLRKLRTFQYEINIFRTHFFVNKIVLQNS
jgi:hypothetical protein